MKRVIELLLSVGGRQIRSVETRIIVISPWKAAWRHWPTSSRVTLTLNLFCADTGDWWRMLSALWRGNYFKDRVPGSPSYAGTCFSRSQSSRQLILPRVIELVCSKNNRRMFFSCSMENNTRQQLERNGGKDRKEFPAQKFTRTTFIFSSLAHCVKDTRHELVSESVDIFYVPKKRVDLEASLWGLSKFFTVPLNAIYRPQLLTINISSSSIKINLVSMNSSPSLIHGFRLLSRVLWRRNYR